MENETRMMIIIMTIILSVLTIVGMCWYGSYMHKLALYDNFQKTLTGLTDEEKCLHICGFQYPSNVYFENYKFCVEKCDRISERKTKCEI